MKKPYKRSPQFTKAEKYPRVENYRQYWENFDSIFRKKKRVSKKNHSGK